LGVGAQQKISDIFRGTLETYGLSHLPEDDKVKVRDLLDGMNGAMTKVYREKAEVYDSAIDYWKNQGYEPEDISFVRRDNRWLLVVGKTFPVYTTDYPLLFPIDTLPSGRYLVRKAIGSGISEIIVKGTIQDFRLAKWQSLGR
jgi:hypothetical protein